MRRVLASAATVMLTLGLLFTPGTFPQSEWRAGPAFAKTGLRGGDAWGGKRKISQGNSDHLLSGRVTRVRDGDTIELSGHAIRLARLDCAEAGTADGDRATRRMKQLVGAGFVTCKLNGEQSYDRVVGSCMLQDGRDLSAVLKAENICKKYR